MPQKRNSPAKLGTESLGFYLSRASLVFRDLLKRSLEESSLSEYVKPGMGNLMFALYDKDSQTQTQLAKKLHLSKMTITRLVRDAEKQGLVNTVADVRDGRATRVMLTPLANQLETEYLEIATRVEDRIAAHFDPKSMEEFRFHLKALVNSLEGETD